MNKTVTQIIEEVLETMCNEYCRYTEDVLNSLDDGYETTPVQCENCPLNRL